MKKKKSTLDEHKEIGKRRKFKLFVRNLRKIDDR